ncbi:hypothetical protein Clacol_006848 [Clathrus columnatus]|uniref:Glycylpeptide N-tetradecanoyltransferase n=1 Tax=Clathrus columnatus TaxID=1419009 RepID=A0AAV5AIB9_9AGAM|nr:hypothetical protein Clacol_006848 [Clathrus columnatus]
MSSSHPIKPTDEINENERIQEIEDGQSSDEDDVQEITPTSSNEPSSSTGGKKKKKKKSKAIKLLSALKPQQAVPQAIVDQVMEKVKADDPGNANVNEDDVRKALDQLKLMDVLKGKTGIGGRNRKEMVLGYAAGAAARQDKRLPSLFKQVSNQNLSLGEAPPIDDGYIEPSKPRGEVRQEPYPLPKEFEWYTVNLDDPNELKEVYELLSANYVEDDDAAFRFQYSAEFLDWYALSADILALRALKPPGYHREWHVGVRVVSNKKLVAFISGVPITIRVRKQYYHRAINIPKLVDVQFTYVGRNMTLARMIRLNKLPPTPHLIKEGGLREMEEKDLRQVLELFTKYMQRFRLIPVWSLEETKHYLLSGRGKGENPSSAFKGRREGQVTWTYVVENPQTKRITDFFSFYTLPSTIIGNSKHGVLEAAYLFYYATDVAFLPNAEEDGRLKARLLELMQDALVIADQAKFDVFNLLTLMDNPTFLQELKCAPGNGLLNFYLYNWRTAPLAGIEATSDDPAGRGIGVVML